MKSMTIPHEGDLYKIYTIDDCTLEIRYGYHSENERDLVEPLPIFPDLVECPIYTGDGTPITAYAQAPCPYYAPRQKTEPEEWCGDCLQYDGGRQKVGRCLCPERKRE